jgi:hypothetical protein
MNRVRRLFRTERAERQNQPDYVYVVIDIDEQKHHHSFNGSIMTYSSVFRDKNKAFDFAVSLLQNYGSEYTMSQSESNSFEKNNYLFIQEDGHNIMIRRVPVHNESNIERADLIQGFPLQSISNNNNNNINNNNNNNNINNNRNNMNVNNMNSNIYNPNPPRAPLPLTGQTNNMSLNEKKNALRDLGVTIRNGEEMKISRGTENAIMDDIEDGDIIVDAKRPSGEMDSKFGVYHKLDSFLIYPRDKNTGVPTHPLTREPIYEVSLHKAKMENTTGGRRRRKTMKKRSTRK